MGVHRMGYPMRPYNIVDVVNYIAQVHDDQGNMLDFEVCLSDEEGYLIYRVYAKPKYYKLDHYKKGRRGKK